MCLHYADDRSYVLQFPDPLVNRDSSGNHGQFAGCLSSRHFSQPRPQVAQQELKVMESQFQTCLAAHVRQGMLHFPKPATRHRCHVQQRSWLNHGHLNQAPWFVYKSGVRIPVPWHHYHLSGVLPKPMLLNSSSAHHLKF